MKTCAPMFFLRQRGVSLVELAITLAALGLMTWAVASSYGNASNQRERSLALAHGQQMREAVRAFALSNARLPCPDTGGSGWEAKDDKGICPAETEVGWLPYRTLGFDLPDDRLRAAYGVYRNADSTSSDADLAVQVERSTPPDVAGSPGYLDVRDLILGFGNAAAKTLSDTHVHLTGDGGPQGGIDCKNNVLFHPAFVIVIPLEDRDGDGTRYDGVHAGLFKSGKCVQAPGTPNAYNNDDIVVADSFSALAGWLAARAP